MKIIDAMILASTKRRAHRVRTAMVTLVSSLLFIVLFFVAIALQGLIDTSKGYGDVGWNENFLTVVQPTYNGSQIFSYFDRVDKELNAELQSRNIRVTDELKTKEEYQSERVRRANSYAQAETLKHDAAYEKSLAQYQPSAIYHLKSLFNVDITNDYIKKDTDPALTDAINIAQKKELPSNKQSGFPGSSGALSTVEDGLVAQQLSQGQSLSWQPGQPYPLFLPYDTLLKLAGKTKPKDAQQVIGLYRTLIKQYQGKTINYCYRNDAATTQLQQAANYNQQLIDDKDTSHQPIDLPKCQALDQSVLKKANLLTEENLTTNPDGTKRLFPLPAAVSPVTQQLSFKVVGFLPITVPSFTSASSIIDAIFYSVSTPPTGTTPFVVPGSVVQKDPFLTSLFTADDTGGTFFSPGKVLMVDFPNRQLQKDFLATACRDAQCMNGEKPAIIPFGSLAVATESFAETVVTGGLYAILVMSVIAGLIIMLSIGKVIADSSREIAVFRAIGAKRFDILQIYTTYGVMLAGSALLMAFLIAIGVAILLSSQYAQDLNLILIRSLGAYETDISLWFVGFNWIWIGLVTAALLVTSLIGVMIPALNAVRGKLSNQMREE